MKKIYILGICMAFMFIMNACNEDAEGVIPSDISGLIAEPCEGGVVLKWDVPSDSSFLYVKVEYQHPVTGKKMQRNASVYQDTLLVDGLLAKDGEYMFNVASVSLSETASRVQTIAATALPVQPRITRVADKVPLTRESMYCNNPDPEQGKDIGLLVDGSTSNFFHTNWHNTGTEPHYIEMTLNNPIETFEIRSWYRGGQYGQCPIEITVLGSNDGSNWETIAELEDDGSGGSSYTTPLLGKEGTTYSYLRYRADRTSDDNIYFALAEMEVSTVRYELYDPEGIYQPEE